MKKGRGKREKGVWRWGKREEGDYIHVPTLSPPEWFLRLWSSIITLRRVLRDTRSRRLRPQRTPVRPAPSACVFTPFSLWSRGVRRKLVDWCKFLIISTVPPSRPFVEAACFLHCAQWVFTSRNCWRHFETDPEWVISLTQTNDCTVLWLDKRS